MAQLCHRAIAIHFDDAWSIVETEKGLPVEYVAEKVTYRNLPTHAAVHSEDTQFTLQRLRYAGTKGPASKTKTSSPKIFAREYNLCKFLLSPGSANRLGSAEAAGNIVIAPRERTCRGRLRSMTR
jgi:hypothetical protein